ncbi:MAG: electron transport complex subunit E [Candidatus Coatesbacteria bacterium]|nr:electron transport complex subunit E [Candidatus Coatesbacteria bacterium]
MKMMGELTKGFFKENPIFVIMLGMCPTLATSTSMSNAVGMGIAATFVLVCSNILISILRKIIPNTIRIPCYIVVIAAFVTIVDLSMKAWFPELSKSLGIFIPLIVVNCIILGRAEAFAGKNGIIASTLDGIGMGIGFTMALLLLAFIRELTGTGKLFNIVILPENYFNPALIMILPPGAFLVLGSLMALFAWLRLRKEKA